MFLEIRLNIIKAHRVCLLCTINTSRSPLPYKTLFTANNIVFLNLSLYKKLIRNKCT